MIVKNWMRKNPDTISSDLSAKEAMQVFETKKSPVSGSGGRRQIQGLTCKTGFERGGILDNFNPGYFRNAVF